ncbi:MAG: hypothetical protein KAW45_06440 [Thermoplasmatales archaeon]|nr:hypothetical protein [Thermoplasmatales archaeon]
MKKTTVLIVVTLIVIVGFLCGCNEQQTPNTENDNGDVIDDGNGTTEPEDESEDEPEPPTTYTVNIQLSSTPSYDYYLTVGYRVYDNLNWQYVDPIIDHSYPNGDFLYFEYEIIGASPRGADTFEVPVGKTYVFQIWFRCRCSNCGQCYVAENMLDDSWFEPEKYFVGTFSSDETFTIHTTGYTTKSDGSILGASI